MKSKKQSRRQFKFGCRSFQRLRFEEENEAKTRFNLEIHEGDNNEEDWWKFTMVIFFDVFVTSKELLPDIYSSLLRVRCSYMHILMSPVYWSIIYDWFLCFSRSSIPVRSLNFVPLLLSTLWLFSCIGCWRILEFLLLLLIFIVIIKVFWRDTLI